MRPLFEAPSVFGNLTISATDDDNTDLHFQGTPILR